MLALLLLAAQGAAFEVSQSPSMLTSGRRVWTYRDAGWLPQIVLGDRGGQLLALAGDELLLLSSSDANPPVPVWRAPEAPPSYEYPWLASSANGDVFLRPDFREDDHLRYTTLKKYRSGSASPEWIYTFLPPPQLTQGLYCDVSRDGELIVSLFDDDWAFEMEIRVHDPATGSPIRTIVHPYIVHLAGFNLDVSPDGSVAAYPDASYRDTKVFDLETGQHIDTVSGIFLGHQALSENGSVLATHYWTHLVSNRFLVFRRLPGVYELAFEIPFDVSSSYWNLAVSDDGSTVVVAWMDASTPARSVVRAYDVATATMTMEHVDASPDGSVRPGDLAISTDGSIFVFGVWGPGSGEASELAVYSRDSSVPIREHPDGGSVYDVEISPDGKRYAAVRSIDNPSHYGPAVIEMYELGGEDLVVRGVPSVGRTITFELHGTPGSRASLLRSFALAQNPIDVPGAGTLQLDPSTLTSRSIGVVPPSGVATYSTAADTLPGMIGRTLWFQGLTSGPRHLTAGFVQLTILP